MLVYAVCMRCVCKLFVSVSLQSDESLRAPRKLNNTEYANGGDMAQLVTRLKQRKMYLPEDKILEWVCQLTSALKHVHNKNILHRDLKT